jgi:hypothetical protein
VTEGSPRAGGVIGPGSKLGLTNGRARERLVCWRGPRARRCASHCLGPPPRLGLGWLTLGLLDPWLEPARPGDADNGRSVTANPLVQKMAARRWTVVEKMFGRRLRLGAVGLRTNTNYEPPSQALFVAGRHFMLGEYRATGHAVAAGPTVRIPFAPAASPVRTDFHFRARWHRTPLPARLGPALRT